MEAKWRGSRPEVENPLQSLWRKITVAWFWCQVFKRTLVSHFHHFLLGSSEFLELFEVKTFAFTINIQWEYTDRAQSLVLGTYIFFPRACDFVPQHRKEITFPHSFFRKVILHLLLWDVCLWPGCGFHERVRVRTAVQLMGGSAFLGFLDAGELQTVQFPPDAYLHNPFLRMSCLLTFKQHHFFMPSCLLQSLELH